MDDFEPFWKQWIPRKRHPWTNRRTFDVRKRKGSAPFYVVKYGREPGMFYRWPDCRRSVANFQEPIFFGVDDFDGVGNYCRDDVWLGGYGSVPGGEAFEGDGDYGSGGWNDVDNEWAGARSSISLYLEARFGSGAS